MKRRRKIPKYRQGIFKPRFPDKNINKTPIEYRSQLEFEYMHRIDNSPKIKKWGSETIWIPYNNPVKKKVCQYWTDLYLETVSGDRYIIEIKPLKEIKAIMENARPKKTSRKKQSTLLHETKLFLINKAKWEAAADFCKSRGIRFITLSEEDLKENKIPFL